MTKNIILFLSVFIFSALINYPCFAETNSEDTLMLNAELDGKVYGMGEKIFLSVKLINIGKKDIKIPNGFSAGYKFLGIEVRDEKNEIVLKQSNQMQWGFVPSESLTLKPEYYYGKKIELTDLYRLNSFGSYTVTCYYFVDNSSKASFGAKNYLKDCWNGSIKSKEIKFSIANRKTNTELPYGRKVELKLLK